MMSTETCATCGRDRPIHDDWIPTAYTAGSPIGLRAGIDLAEPICDARVRPQDPEPFETLLARRGHFYRHGFFGGLERTRRQASAQTRRRECRTTGFRRFVGA